MSRGSPSPPLGIAGANFSLLEHATLPLPLRFAREGDDWIVERSPMVGAPDRCGQNPGRASARPLSSGGEPLRVSSGVRSLARRRGPVQRGVRPRGRHRPPLDRPDPGGRLTGEGRGRRPRPCSAAFLHRLFARGRRVGLASARSLFDQLTAPDAAFRRAEYWVAGAFRAFPQLAASAAAPVRARTLGFAGNFYRDAVRRTTLEVPGSN